MLRFSLFVKLHKVLSYFTTTMKRQTLVTIFFFCIGLILHSCGNSEKSNTLNNIKEPAIDRTPITKKAFLKIDTLNQIPNDLTLLIKGQIKKVIQVDFNGDGKLDFICQYEPTTKMGNADFLQDWITSDQLIVKTEKKYLMDIDYTWFVNIDSDPEPEIFSATGYEDGIDYAFYDQDFKLGKDKLLFYFHPVIIENKKHYWGYPWDISDIILKTDSSKIYIKSSVDNDIERDGNIIIADSTKTIPVIFFYGHSTQPDIKVGKIRNIKWSTIDTFK